MPPPKPKSTAPALTQSPKYPYTIHRVYLCGHPDEYIQIARAQDTRLPRIIHTIVPQPRALQGVTVNPYRQTRQRCAACASGSDQISSARPQNDPRSGADRATNGFLHVLRRERFSGRSERPIRWPEEQEGGSGNDDYRRLQALHEDIEAGRNVTPHCAVSYQERAGRRTVEGPAREGDGKVAYVLQTAVHPILEEGLGHEMFEDGELERAQLVDEIDELLSPRATDRGSPASTGDTQAQNLQAETRFHVRASPRRLPATPLMPSPLSPRPVPHPPTPHPPTSPQPHHPAPPRHSHSPQHPQRHPRPPLPRSPPRSQEQIARNRALTLQILEGRIPPSTERHSDTTPQTTHHRPAPNLHAKSNNVPSYISHQRPFGPTRASGGTTLSYGDDPRAYTAASPQEAPGVSIRTVLETLYASPGSGRAREGGERGSGERGSYGSCRSFESQRHPGRGGSRGE